jgi:hypothetical protein
VNPRVVALAAALALHAAALAALLGAGRSYARGELDRSRRSARRAGLAAAATSAATAVLILAESGGLPCAALALASGAAALLGGLSGKPRPAGEWSALLWLVAVGCLALRHGAA